MTTLVPTAEGNALNIAADNMDGPDDIFISTDAGVVLKITPAGAQTDFATGFVDPRGMDFRPRRFSGDTMGVGNLFVADTVGTIFQVTPDQIKTVFANSTSPNYLVFEVSPDPNSYSNTDSHGYSTPTPQRRLLLLPLRQLRRSLRQHLFCSRTSRPVHRCRRETTF